MSSLLFNTINFKLIKRLLIILDLLFLSAALTVSYYLRLKHLPDFQTSAVEYALIQFIMVSCFYLFGCYSYVFNRFRWRYLVSVITATLICFLIVSGLVFLTRSEIQGLMGRGTLVGGFLLFAAAATTYRFIVLTWAYGQVTKQRWLVCLSDDYLLPFFKELEESESKDSFYFLTASDNKAYGQILGRRWLGYLKQLDALAAEGKWSGLVVGLNEADLNPLSHSLMNIRFQGLQTFNLTSFYEMRWSKVPVYFLSKSWFAFSQGFSLVSNPLGLRVKRFFDILGSLVLLLLTLPIMLFVYLLIKLGSRGPAIYKQVRVGKNNQPFTIYKFRSMHVDAEKDGIQWAQKNDSRVTFVGKIIRKLRIDELPQILNVLRGEMSFIGPRPERPEFIKELEEEIPHYSLRHLLKPGITGWAQVMYRYGSTVDDAKEKLQYDLFYIKDYSLILDLIILFKTLRIVLARKGM